MWVSEMDSENTQGDYDYGIRLIDPKDVVITSSQTMELYLYLQDRFQYSYSSSTRNQTCGGQSIGQILPYSLLPYRDNK